MNNWDISFRVSSSHSESVELEVTRRPYPSHLGNPKKAPIVTDTVNCGNERLARYRTMVEIESS
jgi:hypothetical protein